MFSSQSNFIILKRVEELYNTSRSQGRMNVSVPVKVAAAARKEQCSPLLWAQAAIQTLFFFSPKNERGTGKSKFMTGDWKWEEFLETRFVSRARELRVRGNPIRDVNLKKIR